MRWKIGTFAYPAKSFSRNYLWSKSLICFGTGGGEGRFCWLRGGDGIAMGKIRIYIHKKTPENKRKNCACICHLIPSGGNTSTSAGSRVATMILLWLIVNYNKSEMHKSCKKNTVAYSSPPLHSQKHIFFLLETGHCPPLPRGGGFCRMIH